MKVQDRKTLARETANLRRTAADADQVTRGQNQPANRIQRYFRAEAAEPQHGPASWTVAAQARKGCAPQVCPATTKATSKRGAGPSDHARQMTQRRERAQRIAELPLDYVPSAEFSKRNAEQRITGPTPSSSAARRRVRPPAGLPAYLASLYETPLLTPEQERHLFRKYNYLKYRAARLREKLNPRRPQIRIMNEIERLYKEAVVTKNQIVQANLRLVVAVMKRYVSETDGTFELISEGNLSLIRAAEKFDYMRGFRFSTYANWAIRKNHARQFTNDVKRRTRFQTSREELLEDRAEGHFDPVHLERLQHEREIQVTRILDELDERDRQIIEGRFGLAGSEEKTLKQVGAELGVSKERIRQLESRAMERLREVVQESGVGEMLE